MQRRTVRLFHDCAVAAQRRIEGLLLDQNVALHNLALRLCEGLIACVVERFRYTLMQIDGGQPRQDQRIVRRAIHREKIAEYKMIFRDCTGFVGAQQIDGSQILDRGKPLDDDVAFGEFQGSP